MNHFMAYINTPGYLPDNEAAVFDTAQEAWDFLATERAKHEDEAEPFEARSPEYSETCEKLSDLSEDRRWSAPGAVRDLFLGSYHLTTDGTGSITGPTPGYQGSHDLGLAYTVEAAVQS
jgi:hypothetical protein